MKQKLFSVFVVKFILFLTIACPLESSGYDVVDTGQTACYDHKNETVCPAVGESFYGQDAQHDGNQFSYTDNATGLMWQQADSGSGMDWETLWLTPRIRRWPDTMIGVYPM